MGKPALAPPPGVVSNFNDPYTLDPVLVATIAIYIVLTILGVEVRLVLRNRTSESMLWRIISILSFMNGFTANIRNMHLSLPRYVCNYYNFFGLDCYICVDC